MLLIFIPVGVFLLDLGIKNYIDRHKKLGVEEPLLGGKLILRKYYNKGAFLNFLADRPRMMTALHTGILAVAAGLYAMLFRQKGNIGLKVSLGMILGGGFNNLLDRYRKKHVVDYVSFEVPWKRLRSIVFNISDFFIFAGVLLAVFFCGKEK